MTMTNYLCGYVKVVPDEKIRRSHTEPGKKSFYSYHITLLSATIVVCKASFKESRLKSKVLNFKDSISDGCGKHGNHNWMDDN